MVILAPESRIRYKHTMMKSTATSRTGKISKQERKVANGLGETHLESNIDLARVATGYTILDNMNLNASVQEVEGSLKHTDVRLDTKDDDVLNVTCALEPLVGDAWKIHAELGLRVDSA